jgi:hypothetical protein
MDSCANSGWCKIKSNPAFWVILAAVVGLILLAMFCRPKERRGEQSLALHGGQRQSGLVGGDCASLPPANQPACLQGKLNALTSGNCGQLSGCERAVCQELFPNGVYPRPMTYANVPKQDLIIPPSFSKVYPNGYWPKLTAPLWGTECQTDPIGFYQGDLSAIPEGWVNIQQGALPRFNPFLKPGMSSEPAKTQWPIAQNQGFVGLHEWGMPIGNYRFSGQ